MVFSLIEPDEYSDFDMKWVLQRTNLSGKIFFHIHCRFSAKIRRLGASSTQRGWSGTDGVSFKFDDHWRISHGTQKEEKTVWRKTSQEL
jgi:hypothetical protein